LKFIDILVTIETSKEYVKFSINGENGTGSTMLKANDAEKKEDSTILEVDEPVTLSFALRFKYITNCQIFKFIQ
jgi:hypothetical protein